MTVKYITKDFCKHIKHYTMSLYYHNNNNIIIEITLNKVNLIEVIQFKIYWWAALNPKAVIRILIFTLNLTQIFQYSFLLLHEFIFGNDTILH